MFGFQIDWRLLSKGGSLYCLWLVSLGCTYHLCFLRFEDHELQNVSLSGFFRALLDCFEDCRGSKSHIGQLDRLLWDEVSCLFFSNLALTVWLQNRFLCTCAFGEGVFVCWFTFWRVPTGGWTLSLWRERFHWLLNHLCLHTEGYSLALFFNGKLNGFLFLNSSALYFSLLAGFFSEVFLWGNSFSSVVFVPIRTCKLFLGRRAGFCIM